MVATPCRFQGRLKIANTPSKQPSLHGAKRVGRKLPPFYLDANDMLRELFQMPKRLIHAQHQHRIDPHATRDRAHRAIR